jgi:hypothetical protein
VTNAVERSGLSLLVGLLLYNSSLQIHAQTKENQQPASKVAVNAVDPLGELARATAVQAYVYALAPNGMYQRLSEEVLDARTRKSGFNEYLHFSQLATPEVAPFRAPNNDTLYSTAWLDLRNEPAVLNAPDTGGRYWTAQVMDFDTNTLTNFGARLDGTQGGSFAVIGPGWKGKLPEGVTRSVQSPTQFALVLLRVLVDGPQDAPDAASLQKKFTLACFSRWQKGLTGPASNSIGGVALYKADTPQDRLEMLGRTLEMDPIRPGEEALIKQFAGLGIGPSQTQHVVLLDAASLAQAETRANSAIDAAGLKAGTMVNGWRVMSEGIGKYGHDYLQRAAVWKGGPLANVPEESLYPSAVLDSDGIPLDGSSGRYTLHFAGDQLPPVAFFWSVTMYQMTDGMLVKNPIDRYSIGNRTSSLKYAEDGALTIYVQRESPAKDKESNWLPAPDGPFYMSMRLYGPKPAALRGEWKPPQIIRVR